VGLQESLTASKHNGGVKRILPLIRAIGAKRRKRGYSVAGLLKASVRLSTDKSCRRQSSTTLHRQPALRDTVWG